MSFDVVVIGLILKDYNYLKGKKGVPNVSPGGTGFYSSYSYYKLGLKTSLVTSFNNKDKSLLPNPFKDGSIRIFNSQNSNTTVFKNIYKVNNINYRKQEIIFNNRPITGFVPKAKIYHLGPILSEDIDYNLYKKVVKRKGLKILDIQGLIRIYKNQKIIERINPLIDTLIGGFNILKCDTNELFFIKNYSNRKKIINYLWDKGISEVIVTKGFFGSTIYSSQLGKIEIPPFIPNKIIDVTGCGDVYAAIYAMARQRGYSIYHAGLLASGGSGLKTENVGPLKKSMSLIKKRVKPICEI